MKPCKVLAPFVDCKVFEAKLEVCKQDLQLKVIEINDTTNIECEEKNDNGCTFWFTPMINDNLEEVLIHLHKKDGLKEACPVQFAIILPISIFAAILISGLVALLVLKGCNEIRDRQEYAEFKRNLENGKGGVNHNPLFKSPITTYRNPTYQETGLKHRNLHENE